MGRGKELVYYNGNLKGEYLSDRDCEILDNIIKLSEENGCISDLKHIIYDIPNDDVKKIIDTKSSEFIEKPLGTLEDQQTVGVGYMFFSKRCVLGDSVGLGKTVEVCGLCNLIAQHKAKLGVDFKFLYLTEKTLLMEAREKFVRFTGEYVDLLLGEKKYVKNFALENESELKYSVVGAHSLINSVDFQEYLRTYKALYGVNPFDALFIDESAIIGNTATKTYDNARKLAEDFDWVVVMNATPFDTNLRTFYAQLNFCDETLLPTKTVFEKLYEVRQYMPHLGYSKFSGKYKNQHIFKSQVRYRYLARTRKSIGSVMRDCTADLIVTPLTPVQKELLKRSSMPQMVYDCPSYFDSMIDTDSYTTPKIGAMMDLIKGKLKNESSIIIYSRYKESQKGILKALLLEGISCEVMNGDTSIEDKNKIITKFKLGDIRVLVTNVQKGLDFGHCNNCIFYSYDPNPNKMVQFEGRMTRSKDIVGKHVYLLVSEGNELKRLREVVKNRAEASDVFAGSDFSCVLNLLLENNIVNSK